MTKQNKGHDYSTLLIWAAALVTVVRYSAAFIASDLGQITGNLSEIITVAMGISGFGMGVLDVLGGTYLFDGLRRSMPANGKSWTMRFRVLTGLILALIASGVMILVPFTMSRVMHANMDAILGTSGWLFAWSLLVNLTPYLLIGGVAVSSQVVTVNVGQMTGQMSDVTETDNKLTGQMTGNFPTDWRKVRKLLSHEQIDELTRMSTESICYKYGIVDRTARRWRENAQTELQKVEKPA